MITIRMDVSMHNHAICIAVTYVTKKKTIWFKKTPHLFEYIHVFEYIMKYKNLFPITYDII